ncbi:Arc family DNA-binding protein [Providencia rettgeri]|uniref:Arc family DNA-binding protein n=1 Tax=Providencia rettgeri TaxID=587 RepID=UPI00200B9296|nr:Arc family DNA-binding protein [Providencia rettgeri]UPS64234.1 Arc family DNA-binding protein [Providencia rettgeri]
MARDEPKFTFRMPPEVRDKLKERAECNGRSFNSELLQIVLDALESENETQSSNTETKKLAEHQAEEVKKMVFSTLMELYDKDNK